MFRSSRVGDIVDFVSNLPPIQEITGTYSGGWRAAPSSREQAVRREAAKPYFLAGAADCPSGKFQLAKHGFVQAVFDAYNRHHVLQLRPDDLWLLVTQGVGSHIHNNAEKYRSLFVQHEGKRQIVLIESDWSRMAAGLCELLRGHLINPTVADAFTCDFTTSTPASKVASQITLLSGMQGYFDYCVTLCGIPAVVLQGKRDDWVALRTKLAVIKGIGLSDLEKWLERIELVFSELLATYDGKSSPHFWSHIISCHHPHASGATPTYNGWLFELLTDDKGTPFELGPRQGVRLEKVPLGCVAAPVAIRDVGDTMFYAGFVGCQASAAHTTTVACKGDFSLLANIK
jgi:hypothetical protein